MASLQPLQIENSPSSPPANPPEASGPQRSVDPLDKDAPGSTYERQFQAQSGGTALDLFAVLGLPANIPALTQYGAYRHYVTRVCRHVFERADGVAGTVGPLVPLWSHVNVAKQRLFDDITPERFEAIRADWSDYSVGTWNPFAKVGSEEAAKARPRDAGPCTSMSFPLLLTAVIV